MGSRVSVAPLRKARAWQAFRPKRAQQELTQRVKLIIVFFGSTRVKRFFHPLLFNIQEGRPFFTIPILPLYIYGGGRWRPPMG
jgi:hypothetical protein